MMNVKCQCGETLNVCGSNKQNVFVNTHNCSWWQGETKKTVNLSLASLNVTTGVPSLITAFTDQARKEGWTSREIMDVVNDAVSSDFSHLLTTLIPRCSPRDES